jgi:hypothetical protein
MITIFQRSFLWLILFAVPLFAADAASPIMIPESFLKFDRSAPQKLEGNPDLELIPQMEGARTGKVYLRKTFKGLIIAGTVTGGTPQFATTAAELMTKEHLEIWLGVTPNPELPAIGWGNQFDDIELPQGEASCAGLGKTTSSVSNVKLEECQEFVRKQKRYRVYFNRLFVRQWQLAPNVAVERFAAMAYQTIEERFGAGKDHNPEMLPKLLKPSGVPESVFRTRPDSTGYDFEVLVPWKLFQPTDNKTLKDIAVLIEAYAPAVPGEKFGVYATSAPGRRYGTASTFNQARFAEERTYELTPCDYDLNGLDIHDKQVKALFFPTESQLISDTFILENYKMGYAYGPSGLSPRARPTHFFWKQLEKNEYVCGPTLRYKKGDQVAELETTDNQSTSQVVIEEEKSFDVRRLSDGILLIKDGPRQTWSKYGSGMCGGCPRAFAQFFTFSSDFKVRRVFQMYDVVGNEISDVDVQVSPDWSRIAVYRLKADLSPGGNQPEPTWRDQFYCFKNKTYGECEPEAHSPAPEPRTLTFAAN